VAARLKAQGDGDAAATVESVAADVLAFWQQIKPLNNEVNE
jgi:hypothetical protein